jgi:hypothetical protein
MRPPLIRTYHEGEKLTYRMQAVNESVHYEIQASGVVKQNAAGNFIEEYAWSNLAANGKPFTLPEQSQQFRQILSLDPVKPPALPNLAAVHPNLIGPITDLLTFYVDLWMAARTGKLNRAGDHAYQKINATPSWADGSHVIVGEDSIDFEMTLTAVDRSNQVATLLVRHVPPPQPSIHLPAAWMREPVADTQNNWVQVAKENGKYNAAVGKETFDVQIKVSLADGKILSGSMENPVKTRERDCTDAALTNCGPPRPHDILRKVEISLER